MDATDRAEHCLEELELFHGESNPARSRVYARLPKDFADRGLRLAGSIRGPQCEYAQTLEATSQFAQAAEGHSLLAEAILPEPCFWTPQMPYTYRASLELYDGARRVETFEQTLGLRRFGVKDERLYFEDQAWVLRAARAESVGVQGLDECRETATAMLVADPDDSLCERASRAGVLLVAEVTAAVDNVATLLRRLGRWPAVAVAIVRSKDALPVAIRDAAPNLVLAEYLDRVAAVKPSPWAHAMVCEDEDVEKLSARAAESLLPVIAMRRCGESHDIATARAGCDRLQRGLARGGDFIGYIV